MSERYQTSGKPGACIAAGLWTTVLAVAAAAVLGGCRIIGLYFMLLMPIVFALGVACLLMLILKKTHCRSPFWGAMLGIYSALILILGMYHVGLIRDGGPGMLSRVDQLPAYISFQMESQVTQTVGEPGPAMDGPSVDKNWFWFWSELALAVGILGYIGFIRCRRAFCERCQCWYETSERGFPPSTGKSLLLLLQNGESLPEDVHHPLEPLVPVCLVQEARCPQHDSDHSVYVSIKEVRQLSGLEGLRFSMSMGTTVCFQQRIDQEAAAALPPAALIGGTQPPAPDQGFDLRAITEDLRILVLSTFLLLFLGALAVWTVSEEDAIDARQARLKAGAVVEADVVRTRLGSHGTNVDFQFISEAGKRGAGHFWIDGDTYGVGDQVTVYFDPLNPQDSIAAPELTEPVPRVPIFLGGLGCLLAALGIIVHAIRAHRRDRARTKHE